MSMNTAPDEAAELAAHRSWFRISGTVYDVLALFRVHDVMAFIS
ncbi:MAG: hypothetical protein WBR18_10175 [Anaerolineales bacterium]